MNKKIKFSLLGTLIVSSSLAMALPIVSCSTSTPEPTPTPTPTKTLTTSLGNSAIDATKAISSLFNAKKTFQDQENLLAGWTANAQLDPSVISAIRKNVKFTDDTGATVDYLHAVAGISFSKSFAPLISGSPTSTAQLKIVFTKEYLSSADAFIEIGSLGNPVASTELTPNLNASSKDATSAFKILFDAGKTFYEQEDFLASLAIGNQVDPSVFEAIKKTMTFVNGATPISFDDAVDKIEISKPFDPLIAGVAPTGAELKVIFKNGYTSSPDTIIPIDSLGLAKAIPLEFDLRLANQIEPAMTNALKTELAKTTDWAEQSKLWDTFVKGNNMKDILTSSLDAVSDFNFTEIENSNIINWKDVIKSIVVHSDISSILPSSGETIRGFRLTFVLNPKYSCSRSLIFNIHNLGNAK